MTPSSGRNPKTRRQQNTWKPRPRGSGATRTGRRNPVLPVNIVFPVVGSNYGRVLTSYCSWNVNSHESVSHAVFIVYWSTLDHLEIQKTVGK